MPINLEEIIDIDKMQSLFDSFSEMTGVASRLVGLDGKILVSSGWQDICTLFHRKDSESVRLCSMDNMRIFEDLLKGDSYVYSHCPHGLYDVAAPIIINGTHVANIFTGQLLLSNPDQDILERFRNQATKFGFDEGEYINILNKVPVIPEKKVESIMRFMTRFAQMIGELCFSVLKEKEKERSIQEAYDALNNEIQHRMDEADKLNQIIEGNAIATYVIDLNSKITHWNKACELLTGALASQVIGTDRHQEVFYAYRRPLVVDFIVKNKSKSEIGEFYGGEVKDSTLVKLGFEGEYLFPKLGERGKILFFTAAPLRDSRGNIKGAIGTIQDVTEQRTAERELRASEERYRHLFESANDAIFLIKDGVITDCNQKALFLFRCSREELIGRSPIDISPEIQPSGELSRDEVNKKTEIVYQNVPLSFEWRFKRNEGTLFDAGVSVTKIMISDIPYMLSIMRDITDTKQLINDLKMRKMELDDKTVYLEKVNQALKASLEHREVERRAVAESMLSNLKQFVFPYIKTMAKCRLDNDAKAYLSIIETNLKELVSPISNTMFSKYINLTPTEIRVADFIRDGRNTKEIAELLGLAPSSVQWHRKNIREKFNLTKMKTNLQTFLKTLS